MLNMGLASYREKPVDSELLNVIPVSKKQEIRVWRRLHDEELHKFYSYNTIRVIKQRMR
jgi:hypothetical protein